MDPEELKGSQGSAQKRPDNLNVLLMDFVQAVRTEYDRQTSTLQVLKWPSMELVVKSLKTLENTLISKSQHKIFIEYILQYLDISLCFISSFENTSYRKQRHYATALIGFLPNFFNDLDLKNTFIPEATAKILDMITYGDFSTVSKTALLRMYNEIAIDSKKQIRTDTAESINYYMYKLIDSLSTYGDSMIQFDIMETLFRIFGSQIKNSFIKYELLPGFEELGKSLISDISVKNFEVDVRRWLNKFNKESSSIFSLPCRMLMFGSTVIGSRLNDNVDVIWVDFNMKENMICFPTEDLGIDQWYWVVIMAKDVKKVEVDRQFTTTENTTVFMQLSKPCISDLFERQEYWNSLDRHFKIIISSDEKEKITKLISHVLPRLFGDTFSHTSARISDRLKPVYKPLKISKKRSSHSDLSSVSSKSKSNAVQPGPSRHSAVRVRSPSVSVEMKQSDLQLNIVEDNVSVAVTDFTRCSSRQSGITSRRASSLTSPTSDMFISVSSLADLENTQNIEKIQDNIVSLSYGFDDEILVQTRIQILSGQSTDSRPVSMQGNVSEFRPSEEFSSTPVKTSRLTLKEISDDELLGDSKIMEQRNPLDENENVAPVAQKISIFLGDVETVEQLKPSAKHEKESLVAQKISTFLGDVETAEQLKPADKTEKEAPVFQKISSLTVAGDADKNSNNKSPSQKDLCGDDFFSAEIENIEQKKDYVDKVKENYVLKVSSLIASEDILDDDFETAVEHLTEGIVDETFNGQNDRGDKTHERIEVCKKRSQFVGDNLPRDVDLSSDDELVQPDAETKISHYDLDKNMEQNEEHHISTSKINSKSENGNIQKLKPEESSQCLPSDDQNRTICRQYRDIPTPDLFDLPTELKKVDSIKNEEENDSQNDSDDLFSRTTQVNIKVDQKSQSSDQTYNMLSLAVNIGVPECQYSENVAVVKPVIESKETYQFDKKSYEKNNDQMIDLTLDEDDAKIVKEVKKSQDGKVATNELLLNTPELLEGNVIDITEHVAVVKSLTESGKKSNERSKDNIIDLTVIDDADIMMEVAQSQVQHEKNLVEKVTVDEPLLNTADLFDILASNGLVVAGADQNRTNCTQYRDIPTPDLFDLPTEVNKVDSIKNEGENDSQNDSDDLFSRATQVNIKVDQNSQSSDQTYNMLSLAINVGVSECQYSENVAVVKPVIESKETYQSDKKSYEKNNDQMIDLTLDEDDAKIVKEVKTSQEGNVATNESLLKAPKLLEGNVIGISEHVAVVESLTESGKKFNERSKDKIIDLTVIDDADIMKEVAQSQVQHEKVLVEKVTVYEPLLSPADLFGILASDGLGAAGADQNRTNSRQYRDIPTPDLFDLPTEVNKVDSKKNEEENDSQNDSDDLFSRTTQVNIKVDQNSQSSYQTYNMLSLAVNVGVSECQYSENVAVVKSVIESKETYQFDKKSYEKNNDQMIDLTLEEDDAKIVKEVKKSQVGKVATNESLVNAPKSLEGNVIGFSEHVAVVKSLTESGKKFNERSKDNIIDLSVIDDADIIKEVAQSQVQHEKILVEKVTVDEPLLNIADLFGILASDGLEAAGSELLTNGPEKIGTSLTDEAAREENLTAKKKPRTLTKTGKKQFRLESLSDKSDAPKELEGIICAESNRTVDEVVCIESEMKESQATAGPTDNSDSDLEWVPEMNADNMDFIETFYKIKEMEEQKTAASIHSEGKTVVGNRDVIDTDTLLKNLDKENNLTQLSGKADFIRKKAGKRIISDSEMSEVGEDHFLETTEMKKNIEIDSKVDNLDSLEKEPQSYVKISRVIKKPKELKRAKSRTLKEIGQVKLDQCVHSKTGEPQITVQKDSNQIPHETQNEVAHADEEPVSRTGRDVVGHEIVEEETKAKKVGKGAGSDNKNEVSPSLYKQDEKADVSMQKEELVPDTSSDRQVTVSMVGGEKRDSNPEPVHYQIVVTTAQVHCVANEQQKDAILSQESAEEHSEDSGFIRQKKKTVLTRNRSREPVMAESPVDFILQNNDTTEVEKSKTAGGRKLYTPGSYSYLDDLIDLEMETSDSESLHIAIEKRRKISKQRKPRMKAKKEEVKPSEKKNKGKTPRKSTKPVEEPAKEGVKKRRPSDSDMREVGEDHFLETTEMKKNIGIDSKVDNLDSLEKEPQSYVKISRVIKKPKESKRAKSRTPLKEIGQVKLDQRVHSKTCEPQLTAQKDSNQIPHETQNEVAHADEEPVSRTARDVVGDEIVEEETKAKKIGKGAGSDNKNEVSPSLYKQDEKADVSMQKEELVPDTSSDRQVTVSMVGGEKRDSNPEPEHYQVVVITAQVHCVANEQQKDAILSQESAEEHSEDSDFIRQKRSPILTRNSREPVMAESPVDFILQNNDTTEVGKSKTAGGRKLYTPGSYSYLDDLIDVEMETSDSESLHIAIEKRRKISKQRKPRIKAKKEEVKPSEKKSKGKTPRKSTKPVEEPAKEGVKKRRPRRRKEFSLLSTTSFKSLGELLDMTYKDFANHPWGYKYSRQSKSSHSTSRDILVRSARNSSSEESFELTEFLDKKVPSPKHTSPQFSQYLSGLGVIPENANAAECRPKINILQDIVKHKRLAGDEASRMVSKKPKLDRKFLNVTSKMLQRKQEQVKTSY